MPTTITPLTPVFGAEIRGLDLRDPPCGDTVGLVERAMADHALVVIRGEAPITDEQQLTFSRAFGPLELPPHMGLKSIARSRIRPELYDVSNLGDDGEILDTGSLRHASNKANEEFHTDSSFNALPTKWSILSARVIPPEGGDTDFADTRAAWDALPDDLREKAEGAVAEHWFWKTRGRAGFDTISEDMRRAMPPVRHPVVRVIPESGRKALYIGNHATHVVGWPRAEGEAFLATLNEFATAERFRYRHRWQPGDVVLWDNRCTLHRATGYDARRYRRDLRRSTINEYGPEISSTDALGVAAPA